MLTGALPEELAYWVELDLASTGLVVASIFLLCSEDFTAALVSAGLTYYVETGAVLAGFFSSLANSFLTSFG